MYTWRGVRFVNLPCIHLLWGYVVGTGGNPQANKGRGPVANKVGRTVAARQGPDDHPLIPPRGRTASLSPGKTPLCPHPGISHEPLWALLQNSPERAGCGIQVKMTRVQS